MLDPKLIKENPEKIQSMLNARSVEFDLQEYIQSDKKRRELIIKTDELRKKKNEVALEIGKKKKSGEDASGILNEMKVVSSELTNLELEQEKNDSQIFEICVNSSQFHT